MKTYSSDARTARSRSTRWISKRRAVGVLAGVALTGVSGAVVASAAVPTPDQGNLVVFPDRDFITVEGFQDSVGQTATIEVTRPGVTGLVGAARSTVAAGEVAFEINHPGGVCWGNYTGAPNVTPDLRPGDKVTIKVGGQALADTTIQDAFVNQDSTLVDRTLTIKGKIASGVTQANTEQRIVNPDLDETDIGRRDVRALPGDLVRSDKGGYSSGLKFGSDGTFTATYVFDNLATAEMAASGGGERFMAWQVEDTDAAGEAARQGLTIAEYKELGGPGMGGCPAGPADAAAPQPGTATATRNAARDQIAVKWTPATAAPDAEPVSGYSVVAIAKTASTAGDYVTIGKRTGASATSATINGLSSTMDYTVEVRSLAGPRMSEAFQVAEPTQIPQTPSDTTVPSLAMSPAPGTEAAPTQASTVTLGSESTADIYYTTDGSDVVMGDIPSDAAKLYTSPIPITSLTDLRVMVIDEAGNSTRRSGWYSAEPVVPTPTLEAPANLRVNGTIGQTSVPLAWDARTGADNYGVQVYDTTGAKVGALRETTVANLPVTGLTANTDYLFTVSAHNSAGWGAESAKVSAKTLAVPASNLTIASARWRSGDEFRITGTATTNLAGQRVTVRRESQTGTIVGTANVNVAAGATQGTWEVRVNAGTRPTNVYASVADGANTLWAGPFAVQIR